VNPTHHPPVPAVLNSWSEIIFAVLHVVGRERPDNKHVQLWFSYENMVEEPVELWAVSLTLFLCSHFFLLEAFLGSFCQCVSQSC